MHECPNCGQACDCDGEDTWLNAPPDCECACEDYEEGDRGLYDDPCSDCGPNCPDWGGDGICMFEIRAMAEEAIYYEREQHWYWRAWWGVLRIWRDLRDTINSRFQRDGWREVERETQGTDIPF